MKESKTGEESSVMLNLSLDRSIRYSRSFLYIIVICILVVLTVNERPEFEKLSYIGSNHVSSVASPENGFYDTVLNKTTKFSITTGSDSRSLSAIRRFGSGLSPVCALAGEFFIPSASNGLFLLSLYRDLIASHHLIITYIHNLDGMKP